jgi:predicted RecA/RadA family phage recombinase
MAANVKREREDGTILVTNVATDKASGKLIVVGELVCMHKKAQLASATLCPVFVKGVEVLYTKLTTDAVTEGCKLYFDDTNDWLTITADSLKYAGIATAAAGTTVTTCRCHLGLKR